MVLLHRVFTRVLPRSKYPLTSFGIQRRYQHETKEEIEAHRAAIRNFNKSGYDYEYLLNLRKSQLAYKVIRMQRQLDSYTMMKGVTNVDGRDKIRIEHPDPEDVIDHRDYARRRVAFKVVYLGWDYMAYAWDDRNDRKITGHTNVVERVFLEALLRQQLTAGIGWGVGIDRSGRTDRGVSGLSQVICANVRSNLNEGLGVWSRKEYKEYKDLPKGDKSDRGVQWVEDPDQPSYLKYNIHDRSLDEGEIPYITLLNEALPSDIRVVAWSPVGNNFSPRKGCTRRTYRYFFPRGGLDIETMQKAAQKLVGDHDFRNFGKLSVDNMHQGAEKSIYKFDIEVMSHRTDPNLPECDIAMATVAGSGFLYRQIRLMMAVLYNVGRGHEDASIIDDLLDVEKITQRPGYQPMDREPLILYDTEYQDDAIDWRWDQEALKTTAANMGSIWGQHAMKCEILRCIYENSLEKLPEHEREDVKTSVHNNLISHDGLSKGHRIKDIELSLDRTGFKERERDRTVRRLMKKGRYQHAAAVKSGRLDPDEQFSFD